MVMEFCEHGSLQDYLRSHSLLPGCDRNQIALDAALGLEYLASRGMSEVESMAVCWPDVWLQASCIGM